jgi:hypothetical protein
MNISLARFQTAMADALQAPHRAPPAEVAEIAAQPGFAVYRNTVTKGCIDALQANFPVVSRLVGDEWFRAAAAVYVRTALPQEPMLSQYGAGFADCLAGFEPAAELPYLADVARLDRFWTEAHCARSEPALAAAALVDCPLSTLGEAVLSPHPAARWAWFTDAPIYTIWSRNREAVFEVRDMDWRGEGVLITRPGEGVRWTALDAAGCAFLDTCAEGATIAMAVEAALRAQTEVDLTKLMATLLEAGAFRDRRLDNASSLEENAI